MIVQIKHQITNPLSGVQWEKSNLYGNHDEWMNARLQSYMTSSQHLSEPSRVSSVLIAYLTANSILSQRILRFQNPYWDPSFSHGSPKIDLFLFSNWIFFCLGYRDEHNEWASRWPETQHVLCFNATSEYLKQFQFTVEYLKRNSTGETI